jgi:hypothetical protein
VIAESDYERKRRYDQIESIKEFAYTVLNLYDKLEAEEQALAVNDVNDE